MKNLSVHIKATYILINALSREVMFFFLEKTSSRNIYSPETVEINMGAKILLRANTYISFNKMSLLISTDNSSIFYRSTTPCFHCMRKEVAFILITCPSSWAVYNTKL